MYKRLLLGVAVFLSMSCVLARFVSGGEPRVLDDKGTASVVTQCFKQLDATQSEAASCIGRQLKFEKSTLVLLVKIDMEAVTEAWLYSLSERVKKVLESNQIAYEGVYVSKEGLTLNLSNVQALSDAQKLMKRLDLPLVRANNPGLYQLEVHPRELSRFQEKVIHRNVKIVRYRLRQLGALDVTVLPNEDAQLVLLIPGAAQDMREKLTHQLGLVNTLQFRLVDDSVRSQAVLAGKEPVPSDVELMKDSKGFSMLLFRDAMGMQEYLLDVYVMRDTRNEKAISLTFNPKGAELVYDLTRQNMNKRLAIVFADGFLSEPKILSAPTIMESIPGGRVMISGDFSEPQELENIVDGLLASMSPVGLSVLNGCEVKPSR